MTKARYPKESIRVRWSPDELTALRSAAEAALKSDGKPKQVARQFCEDFYGLIKERMRSPAAITTQAYKLGLGLPGAVGTEMHKLSGAYDRRKEARDKTATVDRPPPSQEPRPERGRPAGARPLRDPRRRRRSAQRGAGDRGYPRAGGRYCA